MLKQVLGTIFSRATVLATALALISACTTTTQQGATGISRSQFLLMPASEVDALALQSYRSELSKSRASNTLNTDSANLERIRRIADRLIPQVGVFRSDALNWQWEVNLQTLDELNAYCSPGGKIMFYTGIIKRLNLSDDEIAAIMGHEMAHALREHGRERMSQAYAQQTGLGLVAALTGMSAGSSELLGMATNVALTLPHSRGQESEADIIGLELLARAGYNPNAAVSLWQKMERAQTGSGTSFMSTHPSSSQRISDLQLNIPKVMALYEQARQQPSPRRQYVPRTALTHYSMPLAG